MVNVFLVHLPEDDEVHAVLVRLVVLVQALLHHLAEGLHGWNLRVEPLRLLHLGVHVVPKQQAPQVLLTHLHGP